MVRRRVGAIGRTAMGPDSQGRLVGGRREGWRLRNAAGEGEGWDGGRAGVAVAQAGQQGGKGGGAVVTLAESQVSALVQLNEAWGGTWPGNTNATTACRQWAGVTCNPAGYVTALQLDPSQVVNGSIPSALVQLSLLRTLDLHTFFLNGTFPATIGALTRLTYLDLGELVAVTGPFANLTWLSSLTSLRYLSLAHNDMYGELPPLTFSTLQQLTFLNLHGLVPDDRPFFRTAIVPQDLSKLGSLETFDAAMNGLLGVLPDSWASLVNLTSLNLGGNQLTGGLPSVFPMTSLSYNNFTGTFPAAALNLPNLNAIYLDYNQFTGPIPAALTRLSFLATLNLNSNRFTGIIPPALHQLSNLADLTLAVNSLLGPIPQEIHNWPMLFRLDLRYNQFTGSLPNFTAWNTTGLAILYLGSNNLTGAIPESIGNLTSLQLLSLDSNKLSGSLPVNISALTQLSALSLGNNAITGAVANTLANLTSLETLWLFGNNLTGTIPSSLCNLTRMNSLVLRNNLFYGTMPSCLVNFAQLRDLDVSNNSLTGVVNRNMKGMNPGYSMLNIAHNFFYGDPTLYANGTLYCPDQVQYNASFLDFQMTGRDYTSSGGQNAYRRGRASLSSNCFDMAVAADSCVANETQKTDEECLAYCGLTASNLPCGGHGVCVPVSAAVAVGDGSGNAPAAATATAGGNSSVAADSAYTCACDDGYYLLWLDNGTPTCSLTPPPAAPAPEAPPLSTGAIIAIVVGGCVALAIVAAAVAAVLILRKQKKRRTSSAAAATAGGAEQMHSNPFFLPIRLPPLTTLPSPSRPPLPHTYHISLALSPLSPPPPRQARTWTDLDVCKEYSIEEVRAFTENWDDKNVLGEGGFATVYRGVNENGLVVAVKRVKLMSNDFETEVRAMATLHHPNLVRLLGFCLHMDVETAKQEQVLVYEFVANGDLDHHIRSPKTPICTPLRPLIPSFGVVLLEILTGKPVTIDRSCHIGKWASIKLHDYQIDELKDKTLTASEDAVLELADIALDCIKRRAAHRPEMADVVLRLGAMVREFCPADRQEGGGGEGGGGGGGGERPGRFRLGRALSTAEDDMEMGGHGGGGHSRMDGRSSGAMTLRSEIASLCANSEIMDRNHSSATINNDDSMIVAAAGSSYVGLQQGPSAR
ncbi:unnamed protein product [Closterium sp. NIES-64]|nr:unnamed protein product [Closterium sp. NIES-64]